jgi:ppGpp synthetase/RelA/SpoT-type nucleotidyltranferase
MTKSQIDQLGNRLRTGTISDADLRLLDAYRRSFVPAYESVLGVIRHQLQLEPTGRPAKSTSSIVEKLKRESIRLSQVQDIAGCRLIVTDVQTQDDVVQRLTGLFVKTTVLDRRARPSHGYRAVHVVVALEGVLVEIQVRTLLQHTWAELSEKLSDLINPSIKYGGGSDQLRESLDNASRIIGREEDLERGVAQSSGSAAERLRHELKMFREGMNSDLQTVIRELTEPHASDHDLPT